MNEKTKYYYYLSYIYDHASKILNIIDQYKSDYGKILSEDLPYSSICMHLTQIGEHARLIMHKCPSFANDSNLPLAKMNGMRNIIIHTYTKVENKILLKTMEHDIPNLKRYLEKTVNIDVLHNPGLLLEQEYDDVIKESQKQSLKPKMKIRL